MLQYEEVETFEEEEVMVEAKETGVVLAMAMAVAVDLLLSDQYARYVTLLVTMLNGAGSALIETSNLKRSWSTVP
jgi:hypothetical protein